MKNLSRFIIGLTLLVGALFGGSAAQAQCSMLTPSYNLYRSTAVLIIHAPNSITVTDWRGGPVATITAPGTNYKVGDRVTIYGSKNGNGQFNGTWDITAANLNQFQFVFPGGIAVNAYDPSAVTRDTYRVQDSEQISGSSNIPPGCNTGTARHYGVIKMAHFGSIPQTYTSARVLPTDYLLQTASQTYPLVFPGVIFFNNNGLNNMQVFCTSLGSLLANPWDFWEEEVATTVSHTIGPWNGFSQGLIPWCNNTTNPDYNPVVLVDEFALFTGPPWPIVTGVSFCVRFRGQSRWTCSPGYYANRYNFGNGPKGYCDYNP